MEYKKHILLISQYFYPENFRVNDLACEWVKRGYRVTVLTGIPNYPMGKYYAGYDRKHRIREEWNGVKIIRIPLIARGNSSKRLLNAIGMAANYFSFIFSGRKWVKSKEAEELKADLVFTFEVSPMTQALIGIWYGKRYNVPTYLYVQDLWPENVETVTGIHSRLVIAPIDRMVDKIYRETGTIFTTSPSFVETIVKRRKPVNRRKVHYWPQYAEDFYRPMTKTEGRAELTGCGLEWTLKEIDPNNFNIFFTGNIGTAQGLDILPRVAEKIKRDTLDAQNVKRTHFVIVGDGRHKEELKKLIDSLGVSEMFTFIPKQDAEVIPALLALADGAFVSFSNEKLWTMTIPAKLQSYMACSKAIIAFAGGETKRIIGEADCGVCVEGQNIEELTEGLRRFMMSDTAAMGKRSREYCEKHFNKVLLLDRIDKYIE